MSAAVEHVIEPEIVSESQSLQVRTPADYMVMAIERNLPVETMREFMALEKEWRAEQAKAAFSGAMVEFGKLKEVVAHNRVGTTAGNARFSYADFPQLVKAVTPLLASCDLSFDHSQDDPVMTNGKVSYVLVHCTVEHSKGHSRTRSFPAIPDMRLDGKVSPSQLIQLAITYAKRQTLSMVLGIATAEDHTDDDGKKPPKGKPATLGDQINQPRQAAEPAKISKAQAQELGKAAKESGIPNATATKILKGHGFEQAADITVNKFKAVLKEISEWTAEAKPGELKVPAVEPTPEAQQRIKVGELVDALGDAGYAGNIFGLIYKECGERKIASIPVDSLAQVIARLEMEIAGLRKK